MERRKILIGVPICQNPVILTLFLHSLSKLQAADYALHYHFIDDNHETQSQALLRDFQQNNDTVLLERLRGETEERYQSHNWNQSKIWKVAGYKDRMIERARREAFDYLFLVDSDLLLHPQTLLTLIAADKEIIAEVFWTKWSETTIPQPQVWLSDFYTQYEKQRGEKLSKEEERIRTFAFFSKLKVPGVYEVGGLGACTLLAKSALERDVSFRPIKNISFWGEDRHFCIRASALGIDLFVDTHHPAFHVFRDAELRGGVDFLKQFVQ